MKRKAASIILVALALSVLAAAQTAPAAGKIGVINIQQAIMECNEGQRDFGALQKKFEPKQAELQGIAAEIDKLKKDLSTQGDKLNEEARTKLVQTIDLKTKQYQRTGEDAQGEFTNAQNEIANKIGQKLYKVMEKYAVDNGYSVILDAGSPQSGVLWVAPTTDVTKPVVEAYNVVSGVPPQGAPAAKPAATGATKPAPKPATAASTPKKPQ